MRARRDALIEVARIRGISVKQYLKDLRDAGDNVTEDDALDAEIADADAFPFRPAEEPKEDDDKDDGASKKASL